MRIDHPSVHHHKQLRQLWQDAFGDSDAFLDSFYRTAYDPLRCRCVFLGEEVAAVLYWIDCTLEDQKLAYIYAVVTHPAHRGKGLCRALLSDTHALLAARGYAAAVLVPQKETLRTMYAGMGYENCGGLAEFACAAGESAIPVRAIGPEEFAVLRRSLLPAGSVLQEGAGLSLLAQQLRFYTGTGFLLAGYQEKDILYAVELLGDPAAASGILKALGCREGHFRTPGTDRLFAMFHPLQAGIAPPDYFGFAFD